MRTITEQIVERLEELANEWSNHTPQCEALFMAAKEASTFQDKDKEQLMHYSMAYAEVKELIYTPEEFFELWHKFDDETFNTNQKNLPDSTNGYTYYPQEHKIIFNPKEK